MRINREIRADKLRVISEKGEQIGVLTLREALMMAEEAGLDLVEIAPTAKRIVVPFAHCFARTR